MPRARRSSAPTRRAISSRRAAPSLTREGRRGGRRPAEQGERAAGADPGVDRDRLLPRLHRQERVFRIAMPVPVFRAARVVADNRRMVGKLVVVVAMMFAFGYALVPIYRAI